MTGDSTQETRLVQGLNYRLNAREVGVMNVYDDGGTLVAHLSVFDPVTSIDDDVVVRASDELMIGRQRYRVVMVRGAEGGHRAWLSIVGQ